MKYLKSFFKRFFFNYCWIGIITILLTIIFDLKIENKTLIIKIFIDFFKTIGISIIVASIFSWASETYSFVEKIQELLKSVVIRRDFLSNLDADSKANTLKAIIKPNSFEKTIYTNIEDYYNYYIKRTLEIKAKNIRSDYNMDARIFYDEAINKICCERTTSYKIYPAENGFDNIQVGFTNASDGKILSIKIYKPEGGHDEYNNLELQEADWDGIKATFVAVELNKFYREEKSLVAEIRTIEYGCDHWIIVPVEIVKPTDGFRYTVICENGIKIMCYDTFSQGVIFDINESEDKHKITISTYQWLNEGNGMMIIASKQNTLCKTE